MFETSNLSKILLKCEAIPVNKPPTRYDNSRRNPTNLSGLYILPEPLFAEIRKLRINPKAKIPLQSFMGQLLMDSIWYNGVPCAPVGYDRAYLKKALRSDYRKKLNKLSEAGLLSIDDSYLPGLKTKTYHIPSKWIIPQFRIIQLKTAGRVSMMDDSIENCPSCIRTAELIRNCSIDYEQAQQLTLNYVGNSKALVDDNPRIKTSGFKATAFLLKVFVWNTRINKFKVFENIPMKTLLTKCHNESFTLFETRVGKKYYYMPKEEFVKMKALATLYSYSFSIEEFRIGRVRTTRGKYGRLHSNLTNMPSRILAGAITIDGQRFKELDLANSQLTILAYCLRKVFEPGYIQNRITEFARVTSGWNCANTRYFQQLCEAGILYNEVAKRLGLTRTEVKLKVFHTLFKESAKNDVELERLFPELLRFCNQFKKEYGHQALARELQGIESILFIDSVFPKLSHLRVATKHDSFLVHPDDFKECRKIVKRFFSTLLGPQRYKLK